VPLLATPLSKIGSIYLTSDGTADGEYTRVLWVDRGTRPNPIRPVVVSIDATSVVYNKNTGRKGPITLRIPSCPDTLRDALKVACNNGGHKTATLYHAAESVTLDVEYLRIDQPEDTDEWQEGDPREVIVRLWSHGQPEA
jgi:hypothetical protein